MRIVDSEEHKERIANLTVAIAETIRKVDDDTAIALTSLMTLVINVLANMGLTRDEFSQDMLVFWDRYRELNNAPK